jgi:hypothetical protein
MSIVLYHKPNSIDLARNYLFLSVKGTGASGASDYKIIVKIFVENLSDKETPFELPPFKIDFDADNIGVLYDIGNIITRKFNLFLDLPEFNSQVPQKCKGLTISYSVLFEERDGDTVLSSLNVDNMRALNGKINSADHVGFNISSWLSLNKKFLTNSPARINCYYGSKHYLTWLNIFPDHVAVRLRIDATTLLGIKDYTSDVINLASGEGARFPIGDIISAKWGKEILQARVWLENIEGVSIAGVKTLNFSDKPLYAKTFLFMNRFGVFDSLITISESNNYNVEREIAKASLPLHYNRNTGDLSSKVLFADDIFEAETGPISITTAQHYKEFAESKVIFLQGKDRFVRIAIEPSSFKISDENSDLQNVTFKYRSAFAGDILNNEIELPTALPEDYSREYLKTDYR